MALLNDLPPPLSGKRGWPWTEEGSRFPDSLPNGRKRPLISIVTPSFNQAQYLETTMRSVLLQGYPCLEYIVIDGGSTDGSVDIIKRYEPWLTSWVSEKDNGQAHAINKGFERARGEILAWLNSDDQYGPKALLRMVGIFLENPEVDLVYGDCAMIDSRGRVVDYIEGRPGALPDLLARDFIPQPSTFFRRRAWEAVGGLNASLRFILDFDLWIRMMLKGVRSLYIPVPLSRFRSHGVSKSNREVMEFGYEYLDLLDGLFEGPYDPGLERARLKGYHHAFSIIASGYERLTEQGEHREQDVLEALEQWKTHLERYEANYTKSPGIWAESLYRIGQSYCLHGQGNEGRKAFLSALRVRKREYRALIGLVAASLGSGVYRRFTSGWRTLFSLAHHVRRRFHVSSAGH